MKSVLQYDTECRHEWDNPITGFRHDGSAIGRCKKCNMPIVNEQIKCTPYILKDLYGSTDGIVTNAIAGEQTMRDDGRPNRGVS